MKFRRPPRFPKPYDPEPEIVGLMALAAIVLGAAKLFRMLFPV